MSIESKMPYDRDLEMNYREITCKRQVGGAAAVPGAQPPFAQGVQDYDFSVSGKNAWIPGYSYFRIDASVYKVNAGVNARVPVCQDGLALTDNFGGCLYNNAYFRAGSQDVSIITQYLPQASSVKARLDRSGAWLEYLGQDGPYNDADYSRRVNKISQDGTFRDHGFVRGSNKTYTRPTIDNAGVVVVAPTGAFTIANSLITTANMDFLVSGIQKGDIVILNNAGAIRRYIVNRVVSDTVIQVTGGAADYGPFAISFTTDIAVPVAVSMPAPVG